MWLRFLVRAFIGKGRGRIGPSIPISLLKWCFCLSMMLRISSPGFFSSCSFCVTCDCACFAAALCSGAATYHLDLSCLHFCASCFLCPVEPVDARPAADRGLTTRPGITRLSSPLPPLSSLRFELEPMPSLSCVTHFSQAPTMRGRGLKLTRATKFWKFSFAILFLRCHCSGSDLCQPFLLPSLSLPLKRTKNNPFELLLAEASSEMEAHKIAGWIWWPLGDFYKYLSYPFFVSYLSGSFPPTKLHSNQSIPWVDVTS